MGRMIRFCVSMTLLPSVLLAQRDSIHLTCPLNDATVVVPPINQILYDEPDYCITLISSDRVVKAVTNGKITNVVNSEEDGRWEVVFCSKLNNKEYYFWYSGMKKVLVRRTDVIIKGQAIGYLQPGEKIDILMYEFETPVDPAKYLDCNFLRNQAENVKVISRI